MAQFEFVQNISKAINLEPNGKVLPQNGRFMAGGGLLAYGVIDLSLVDWTMSWIEDKNTVLDRQCLLDTVLQWNTYVACFDWLNMTQCHHALVVSQFL